MNKTILTLAIIMMMVGVVSAQEFIDPSYHSATLSGTTLTLTAKVHNLAKDPPNVARVYEDGKIPTLEERNEGNDYLALTLDASAVSAYMFCQIKIGNKVIFNYFPDLNKKGDLENFLQYPATFNIQTHEWVKEVDLSKVMDMINNAKANTQGISVTVRYNPVLVNQGRLYWPWLMVSDPNEMYMANF